MQVDFDDVRDSVTGVSEEDGIIVQRLGPFTEVSASETASPRLFASLPGQFVVDFEEEGGIELYTHGRSVGATWIHFIGNPEAIERAQDAINA